MAREAFLKQSVFNENDAFNTFEKQYWMLRAIFAYHDSAEESYHIWGTSWMMQFGELPTGGYFWRPAYINHHYELGLTYLALEKKDQAAAEFQKCLDLPKSSSKDDMIKGWAEAELKKLKKG